jgi:hypothetical protein
MALAGLQPLQFLSPEAQRAAWPWEGANPLQGEVGSMARGTKAEQQPPAEHLKHGGRVDRVGKPSSAARGFVGPAGIALLVEAFVVVVAVAVSRAWHVPLFGIAFWQKLVAGLLVAIASALLPIMLYRAQKQRGAAEVQPEAVASNAAAQQEATRRFLQMLGTGIFVNSTIISGAVASRQWLDQYRRDRLATQMVEEGCIRALDMKDGTDLALQLKLYRDDCHKFNRCLDDYWRPRERDGRDIMAVRAEIEPLAESVRSRGRSIGDDLHARLKAQ